MALKFSRIHFSEMNNDIILDVQAHLSYAPTHRAINVGMGYKDKDPSY
jgi:hypothetical protein